MRTGLFLADRTAVLFLGVAAGAAIGYAFAPGGKAPPPPPPVSPSTAERPTSGSPAAVASTKPDIAQECALPFQPHLLKAVEAGDPITVGVFGDSFGDGVWSALYRLLPAKEKYRVLKFSQQSTGFTRYATRNVEQHAQAQIAAQGPVDVAVVSFGANDTQGVYADGHAAPLMSPEWQRVIGGRVDEFVRMMRSRGAVVYWLGLPKMRAAAFDADIAAMNAFYERRMKALQVPFIDIRPLTVDAAGDYAPYLPDGGSHEPRLMRANDGIHMTMNGYVTITRALADRIKAYVAAAHVMAGAVPPVAPPVVPPPAPVKEPEAPRRLRPAEPKQKAKRRVEAAEPRTTDAAEASTAKPKAPAETPPVRPKADAPAAKPKVDADASPKPRPDAAAQPKPKTDVPPATKPKAETPAASAKPKAEPATAKPKAESAPTVRPHAETKPKSDAKAQAKPSSDKPAAKPATTSKPSSSSQARPPLQLNLPPPEESRRSPSAPPTTDRP